MSITSALVLFVVIWFMVLFVTLPIHRRTQGDDGEVLQGTPAGAPTNFNLKRTLLIVTAITTPLWAAIAWVIISGTLTVEDIDWFNRMERH